MTERQASGDWAAVRAGGWWCVPCTPTANRTALQTQDFRPGRALCAPGAKLVRPQPGRPGRALTVSPGLPALRKKKLRRRRMGVISPPRFFLRFFRREGQDARGGRPTASRSLASLSSCYAGRGGKTRLKGFSTSSRKGTFSLSHQGNFSHCADRLLPSPEALLRQGSRHQTSGAWVREPLVQAVALESYAAKLYAEQMQMMAWKSRTMAAECSTRVQQPITYQSCLDPTT